MLIDDFNDTIDTWIAELEHYSFETLLIKADPASWSIGQVYLHLIDESTWYMEQFEVCFVNKNSSEELAENAKVVLGNNGLPDQRIRNDANAPINMKQPGSKQQLQEAMQQLKLQMNELWSRVGISDYIGKAKHPGLGYLNAREWVQFTEIHLRHHFRQKARIDEALKK